MPHFNFPIATPRRPLPTAIGAACIALSALIAGCGGGESPGAEAQSPPAAQSADAQEGRQQALTSKSLVRTMTATVITLRARSDLTDNVGAYVKIRYNGQVIAAAEVRSTQFADLVFRVMNVVDGGMLDVVFTNATHPNGIVARQLSVQSLTVNGAVFSPTGPGVSFDAGHGLAAFDGAFVTPGQQQLSLTGALRFPMPAATQIGTGSNISDGSMLSPAPGLYVHATGGSDTYTGTFDRPFRTLARAASVPMLAGEHIHLRCGSVWRESMALGVSNMADGTEIRSYGDCANEPRPVITGADSLKGGWVRSGPMWVRSVPAGTPKIERLLVGFHAVRTAQWPNATQPQPVVQSGVPGQAVRFNIAPDQAAFLAQRDIAGASLMIRTQAWRVESRRVVSLQGATLGFDTAPEFAVEAQSAWLLRDKFWMLDAPGEFFHDTVQNKVYLIPSEADAQVDVNGLEIEGSVRDVALDLRARRGLVVKDVALRMARADGLRMTDAPEARLSNLEVTNNASAGIRLMQWLPLPPGAGGPVVEGSMLAANGEYGVDARYVKNARISDNRVQDTGVADYTGPVDSAIAGGPGARIVNNVVQNSGYVGIRFCSIGNSVVAGNEVSDYCKRLSDCGGIYSWTARAEITPEQAATVEGNRVFTAKAVAEGSAAYGNDLVAGIYLDDHSQRTVVRNNFLHAMPVGIFVHNGALNTVENNRIWMPQKAAISVSMDRRDGDWSFGNTIRNNEIVPYTTTLGAFPQPPTFFSSHAFWFEHALSGEAALAPGRNVFQNNRVVQLHGANSEHAKLRGPVTERNVTAAEWQTLNPLEPRIEQPVTFASYWAALGPERVTGGNFDAGLGSWGRHWNWQLPGYDLAPVANVAGCNGPCLRMTSGQNGDMVFSPAFSMPANRLHMYRWTAVAGNAPATMGWPYISRNGSPWDEMNDWRGFQGRSTLDVGAGQTLNYEAFFVPKSSDSARVNIMIQTQGVPVSIDSVSVREVEMWLSSGPSEWVAAAIAPRGQARIVNSCGDVGLPADCALKSLSGADVTLPVTVPANEQQLFLWANSPYRK